MLNITLEISLSAVVISICMAIIVKMSAATFTTMKKNFP